MQGCARLEQLDVRNNDMEADSAVTLASSLRGKSSLQAVKLDEDVEEFDVIEQLYAALEDGVLQLGDDDDDDDDDEEDGSSKDDGESGSSPATAASFGGFSPNAPIT